MTPLILDALADPASPALSYVLGGFFALLLAVGAWWA